jgi:nicotinamidase-related amidase
LAQHLEKGIMRNVINFPSFASAVMAPTLVLLDLQQEYIASSRLQAIPEATSAIGNCRTALAHARRRGFPVAFFRMVGRSSFSNPAMTHSKWIAGFEPVSSDMVFERSKPSCYANREFANAMMESGGHFVLAGFSGEAGCLATVLEAFHRDHHVTFLADASASHSLDRIASRAVHDTVVAVIDRFGEVTTTGKWMSELSAHISHRTR